MIAWVALKLRIPILMIYHNELHKDILTKFLEETWHSLHRLVLKPFFFEGGGGNNGP